MNTSYVWLNNEDSQVFRSDLFHLLCAQDSHSPLIEAVRIFLCGDVEVNREDKVRPGEVQVNGQSHLQQQEKSEFINSQDEIFNSIF